MKVSYQPRFDWSLDDAVEEARSIIEEAVATHRPNLVFALLSGGGDSTSMLDIARPYIDAILHVDTTTGVQATQDWVKGRAQDTGFDLLIRKPPVSYYDWCHGRNQSGEIRGFPSADDHPYAYRILKKTVFREVAKEHTTWRGKDKVMYLTGMRSEESNRRMLHGAKDRVDERIAWINPIRHFSTSEKNEYLATRSLPTNPVNDVLGKSGECLCGCFSIGFIELDLIRDIDPDRAAFFDNLQEELRSRGCSFWKWGERGSTKSKSCNCIGQDALPVEVPA